MINLLLNVLLTLFALGIAHSQTKADEISWKWLIGTDKAQIKIDNIKGFYFGRIVWLKEPINNENKPKIDVKYLINARKSRSFGNNIVGWIWIQKYKQLGKVTIYDPENGKTYICNKYIDNKNTMKIRGFIGISLIDRKDTWSRIKQ